MRNHDYIIDSMEVGDIGAVLQYVDDLWPDARVHLGDENSVEHRPLRSDSLDLYDPALNGDKEFFVYRNEAAVASWDEDGRTDDNDPTMIHVLIGSDSFTFVWVRSDTLGDQLVEHIKDQRIERRVMERLREKLQLEHARRVYEHVERHIRGWQSHTLNDNDTQRLAEMTGVELKFPAFLDRLLETLHSVVVKNEIHREGDDEEAQ